MFRTFQLLSAGAECLGEITLLLGQIAGRAAARSLKVRHLKYKSPRKGFQALSVVVEGNRQLPVRLEGDQWEWATKPPPGWKTGQGIPYDIDEALATGDGRPYGFNPTAWKNLKANFMKHATRKQKEFPKDFYINVELERETKEKAEEFRRERRRRRKEKWARIQRESTNKMNPDNLCTSGTNYYIFQKLLVGFVFK